MTNRPEPFRGAATQAFAEASLPIPPYLLKLYITGSTPRSIRAISNIRAICEEYLRGRYDLEIVDISQHPEMAESQQIVAAPTLIKAAPLPVRRFIGDLSDTRRIVAGLDLQLAPDALPSAERH